MTKDLKILFVEDREDDMLLVLRALSKGGYKVRSNRVQNEAGERKMLSEESWDLVIADFSMPGFSGAEALKIFKEYKLDIPFVLVSGSVGEDIAVQMMKDGASDYVMKDKLARIVPAIERELAECEVRRKKKVMEDELHRASLIIESTDVILWQWKPVKGWPVTYVSSNVSQFGYETEDFLTGKILYADFVHPEDRELIFENSIDNMYHHRDLYKQNYRVICKDGSIRWLDDYTTIVRDNSGEVTMIQGITYDVTDNTLLGKDLDRSQNLYRSLVDTSPDGICMLDMEFKTIFANKRKAELFGYDSPEEMLGMSALQTLAPGFDKYLLEQQVELFGMGKLSIPEVEFVRKNGSRFFGELRMVLIRDEEGSPVNVINLVTDITERKQMQESLIESENRFRVSFENAPIGMDMIRLDGVIMRANRAFCELLAYTEEELQSMSFYDFTHPEDKPINIEAVNSLIKGAKESVNIEKRYIRKDGEIIWVNVNSTLIKNSQGQPQYFLAQVQDITHSRRAEEETLLAKTKAEESDRLKSALLANMSHELRTPLNGIMGFSDLIRKANIEEGIKGMAEMINKSGKRLMNTLDSIMLLAQLEAGQKAQELAFSIHNTSEELLSICSIYKDEIEAKGFDFIMDIQPDMYLNCEIKLLRQAVIKLLENAIKFTQRGSISLVSQIENGNNLVITIADTGIGFGPELKKSIFEEFRQASEGYGRAYEGSGLGLAITQKIIALFGGSLSVESEVDRGSVFSIRIPYSNLDKNSVVELEPRKETRPLTVDSGKDKVISKLPSDELPPLLIVEDNPVNQKLAASFLKNHYKVDCAATGEIAVEMAKEKQYFVVLMDINLGSGMDGIQTTQVLRKMSGYEHIPIIAVTGYTLIGDRERILAGGCTHYLGKPFSRDQLIETINVSLGS